MIRLAIDTSCAPPSLALQKKSSMLPRFLKKERGGAEYLICEIKNLMSEADLDFFDLDEILVARGPGRFMSLRVGLAAARGLGLAAKLPVKGASTFAVFAAAVQAQAKAENAEVILALAASTMGRMIFQFFTNDLSPCSPIKITRADELNALMRTHAQNRKKIHLTGQGGAFTDLSVPEMSESIKFTPLVQPLAEIMLSLPPSSLSTPAEPLYPPS